VATKTIFTKVQLFHYSPCIFQNVSSFSSELADYLHNKEHLRRGNQSQIETRSLLSRYEQQTGKHVEDMLREPVIFYTYVDRDRYEPHQVIHLYLLFLVYPVLSAPFLFGTFTGDYYRTD
jgi:hypothetical protein